MSSTRKARNFQEAQVQGDGDCFNHTVMLGIIHDVLTGQLDDTSNTALHIKANLLPAIQDRFNKLGVDVDFSQDTTLKQSIQKLLYTAPLSKLPNAHRLTVNQPVSVSLTRESALILQSDLFHLLSEVTGPAMRKMMVAAMLEHQAEIQNTLQDVLHAEFIAYIRSRREFQAFLSLTSDQIEAAKFSSAGGELYLDKKYKGFTDNLHASWQRAFNDKKSTTSSTSLSDEWLNTLYFSWWAKHKNEVYQRYVALHSQQKVSTGTCQQQALAKALHCNFRYVNVVNKKEEKLFSMRDQTTTAHTFYSTAVHRDHFNAVLGIQNGSDETIAKVIQNHVTLSSEKREFMNSSQFPWRQGFSASDSSRNGSDSEETTSSEMEASIDEENQLREMVEQAQTTTENLIKAIPTKDKKVDNIIRRAHIEKAEHAWREIIKAAKTGYCSALQSTTFGKHKARALLHKSKFLQFSPLPLWERPARSDG